MNPFEERLVANRLTLKRGWLRTLQINVGRKCNQTCRHCHVDAAPWRTEMMPESIAKRVGEWISTHRPPVVDITGGAPELSEHFRSFVETARGAGCQVIDRNNLTIIETTAYGWLPEYLALHEVEVVASLPCYLEENVNAQRGDGVFATSIAALRKLNAAGYGTRLPLNLVYNPLGPKLPPAQAELEADYKRELRNRYGIEFSGLFIITNQPIARFYAAGDVLGENMFVYAAAYEGGLAAENALTGARRKRDYTALPWVVFTDPQVAGVGQDEKQAAANGLEVDIAILPLSHVPRSLAARDTRGFIKLIRNRQTDQLVGARVLAPEGSELLMEISLAIKFGFTVRDLTSGFHPYLTLSEGLKLAALTFYKDMGKLSCCAA